jgi:hypothetical protein
VPPRRDACMNTTYDGMWGSFAYILLYSLGQMYRSFLSMSIEVYKVIKSIKFLKTGAEKSMNYDG